MENELSRMISAINAEIDREIMVESCIFSNSLNGKDKVKKEIKKLKEDEVDSILEDRMYKSYNLRVEDVEGIDEKIEKRKAYLDDKYNLSVSFENSSFSFDEFIRNEEEKVDNLEKEEKKLLRYGKGLPHDENGELRKGAFKSLLRALKKGTDESYNKVFNGCPIDSRRKFHNLQSCDAFDLYGEDISTFIFSPSPSPYVSSSKEIKDTENANSMEDFLDILVKDLECLFFLEYQRDLPLSSISLPESHSKVFSFSPSFSSFTLSDFIKDEKDLKSTESKRNYMDNFEDWLKVQKGYNISHDREQEKERKESSINTGRDLAWFVYEDPLEFFLNLTNKLFKEKKEEKMKNNNPYRRYKNRDSNLAFGKYSIYSLLGQAAERALKYAYYLKWNVCLIPRPEELAYYLSSLSTFSFSEDKTEQKSEQQGNKEIKFLSQVYPEGSNVSPSYPCGKIAVVAACSTILKAFFDSDEELNLVINNWALGILLSGTNYPTDVKDGIILGEKVAISILKSHLSTLTEDFKGFYFKSFSNEDVYVSTL